MSSAIPLSSIDINFKIESVNHETNSICVRPYSSLFANPLSTYPVFNYDLYQLDETQDLATQIGKLVQNYVVSVVQKEAFSLTTNLSSTIENALNSILTMPLSSSLFAPRSVYSPDLVDLVPNPSINFVA